MKTTNLDKIIQRAIASGTDMNIMETREAVDEDIRAACETAWLEGVFYKGQILTAEDHAKNPYARKGPQP